MNWKLTFEIVGVIGGITAFIALMLAPMFYLGSKFNAIYQESKDFHGRLCVLEERYLQMMHRLLEKHR